jgi:F-type H+-transporting ATPase subunit alpha
VHEQVAIIYAGINGYLDQIEVKKVKPFIDAFRTNLKNSKPKYEAIIKETKTFTPEAEGLVKEVISSTKQSF